MIVYRSDIINNNRFKQEKNKMIRMSALASKYNIKFHEALNFITVLIII